MPASLGVVLSLPCATPESSDSAPPDPADPTATAMRVRKRSGAYEPVDLNKIVRAVSRCAVGLAAVDAMRVATRTIAGLYDGAPTRELDALSIQTAAALTAEDPEYSRLAARLLATAIGKEVTGQGVHAFSQSVAAGQACGRINARTADFVAAHARKLNAAVDTARDDLFEYFGLRTVYDRYLLRHPTTREVLETPQYFFLRVACALADTVADALALYRALSRLEYLPGSPTLFNAGTTFEQLSSCYLLDSPVDSLEGIYDRYKDVALLAKYAGGIGLAYHRVRSQRSLIASTNGFSQGIVPWLKTLDASVAAVQQGNLRRGACCVYLESWHSDVEDFLELRDGTGDEARRVHHINLANWVPDLFMRRVEQDALWSLFDPKIVPTLPDLFGREFEQAYEAAEAQKLYAKQVPARALYAKMMKTLAQTGNGWMTFKDACNRACNQTGDGGGVVHLSNLCVAPETKILTDQGQLPIGSLKDQTVRVWNGGEWSEVTVRQTATAARLVRVELSNGVALECTPAHKFILSDGTRVAAAEIATGAALAKCDLPVVDDGAPMALAYTHGFYCGNGSEIEGQARSLLLGEDAALLPHLAVAHATTRGTRTYITFVPELPRAREAPQTLDVASRLAWFAGLCDARAIGPRPGASPTLRIASPPEFLRGVRLLLQTLGVDSQVCLIVETAYQRERREAVAQLPHVGHRLLVSSVGVRKLQALGFRPRCLALGTDFSKGNVERPVRVESVTDVGRVSETYCFNEPLRHAGMFNGVLTGNCSEIVEVTDQTETAVCNLGSINLGRHVALGAFDFAQLSATVHLAVQQLDRVIDRNFYPIPSAATSNQRWRPIGLGVMGLQDVFFKLGLPFDCDAAKALSARIAEAIYFFALEASCDLAEKLGAHPAFAQTRAARGQLQFDAWGVVPGPDYAWEALRARVQRVGLRNALLIAIAPTATIASIAGSYECIEPQVSNLFKRETLSGDFLQVNRYLVADLKALGLWTEATRQSLKHHEGSVQQLAELPPSLKEIYRTVWEVPMRSLIDMAADRGAFVDQSQSLNLFVEIPTIGKLSSMYFHAWKRGLKTTYYLRSRPATRIAKTTAAAVAEPADAVACSLENPGTCESCQ
jgi:ribonucleoside-diphosphate reductase alpha chain